MEASGLTYHERTDSIILGYEIGSAETEHGTLHVVGSGRTIRFTLDGAEGYVDLDFSDRANAAYEWLARKMPKAKV